MQRFLLPGMLWLATCIAVAPAARAQQPKFARKTPHIGYIYPAGGRQGTTFTVAVGGQFLDGVTDPLVSGEGVQATVVKHTKPLTQRQMNQLREKLEPAWKKLRASKTNRDRRRKRGPDGKGADGKGADGTFDAIAKVAREMNVDADQLRAFVLFRKQRADPKRQANAQIAETVTLEVTLAPDAELGPRDLRLIATSGLSNPLWFHVGHEAEYHEKEPNDTTAETGIHGPLPIVLNGQILPGDVDRFQFQAHRGERLVATASARELIPYLADAVPGWFQATLALYDANGRELAYVDDYLFRPDPVLLFKVPADGQYILEIKDAVYRGREDFVYRIRLGETPFVTSIFPLGGRAGNPAVVELKGWNLPVHRLALDAGENEPGVHWVSVRKGGHVSNRMPFAVGTLPECREEEPNDETQSAQRIDRPLVVNGRVDRPGDWDLFRFEGRAGEQVVAEVHARRLNSPLDSLLELTDASGRQLAENDDNEDKGEGLTTHHADSRLSFTLPADGTYYLRLGDTQHKGGTAYSYRLRVGPPQPDFELRVVPSSISARAGETVPITVYALRRDGFAADITIQLLDGPPGFALSGGRVPGHLDKVRLTLTVPAVPRDKPFSLRLVGRAVVQGREISRPAVPAEDMMQAFIYRHLVAVQDLIVAVTGRGRPRPPLKLAGSQPVKLPAGGTVRVRILAPARPRLDELQLALNDPPEGIAITDVAAVQGGVAIVLRADADKVQPGLKGNLIVDAFLERTAPRGNGKQRRQKRRVPLGTLPAIPFDVVGR